MIDSYLTLLRSSRKDRQGVFEASAEALGTRAEFAEKDFWVCLTLEVLFGGRKPSCPMTFKGGTSLSKAFGLVRRFSEDIDIALSPEGLGIEHDFAALAEMSGKQRTKALANLQNAATTYVGGALRTHIEECLGGIGGTAVSIDPLESQTVLIAYPSIYAAASYIQPTVRVECGPRSAHEPATLCDVAPYVSQVTGLELTVPGISTISAERTFWEKIFILHAHHCRYRDQKRIPAEPNRLSRHYYDVAMLNSSPTGESALSNLELLASVRKHNQLMFAAAWRKYDEGKPGTFLLVPQPAVRDAIQADYAPMSAMVFGDVPDFSWVIAQIESIQQHLNTPQERDAAGQTA